MMSWSRASRTFETRSRLPSSWLIWASFSATLAESRDTPSSAAAELLGGVAGEVGERGERAARTGRCRSARRSPPGRRTPRRRRTASWCARPGSPRPRPADRTRPAAARGTSRPRRVFTLIAAAVSGRRSRRRRRPGTSRARGRRRARPSRPCRRGRPAIRTSSLALRPPASLNGGVVGVATADQRQVLGPEGGQDQRRDHGKADRPDDDGVALAEGLAHPRSHLSAILVPGNG